MKFPELTRAEKLEVARMVTGALNAYRILGQESSPARDTDMIRRIRGDKPASRLSELAHAALAARRARKIIASKSL